MRKEAAEHKSVWPSASTSVVGRETEQREVIDLLERPEVRLLTLVGPPGAGKTRLALLVADALASAFAHGAVFVDLVPVDNPALVMQAIAAALGVRDMGGRDLGESVAAVLRDQELLLVLDNFEHVLDAVGPIHDVLASCTGVRVLATSRATLGLAAEYQYQVPPLPVPVPRT